MKMVAANYALTDDEKLRERFAMVMGAAIGMVMRLAF